MREMAVVPYVEPLSLMLKHGQWLCATTATAVMDHLHDKTLF